MTPTQGRHLLAELNVQPSKALGQSFLVDANILRIIVTEADLRRDETVLEIGPGLGVLTAELMARAGRVVAIEKDRRLCEYLRQEFPGLDLREGDAVELLGSGFGVRGSGFPVPGSGFKVVANLPYSVSTPLLERLGEAPVKPRRMVVTLQREVAQRLTAPPRCKDYGALTVLTQLWYHVTIAHVVSPRCFYPAPTVDSAIVVLDRRDPRVKLEPAARFREIVRAGFGHRRKMLRKLLAEFGDVEAAFARVGVKTSARAEELSLEQWILLANAFPPGSADRV